MGKRRREPLWIIDYRGIDPSASVGPVAYVSREKALDAAVEFVTATAEGALEEIEHDDEARDLLLEVLASADAGRKVDAINAWLEYQSEYNPPETIILGPSGDVSGDRLD